MAADKTRRGDLDHPVSNTSTRRTASSRLQRLLSQLVLAGSLKGQGGQGSGQGRPQTFKN